MKTKLIFFTVILSLFFGCEDTSTAIDYKKIAVVNATLTAGETIDTLHLNWSGRVDTYYDPADYAIPNATVIVRGVDIDFYDSLIYDASNPGRYYSNHPANLITPTKTYTVDISIPGWNHVSASTTVPDTFSITGSSLHNGDTVWYNPLAEVNNFYWTASKFQNTYFPTITYLDSNAALIPKSYYGDTTSSDFQYPPKIAIRVGLPSDQTNSDLPWVFLSYYGNIRFDVYAIDFNISDYTNQIVPAQGGELKDIRYNVNGGIGVFGSRARATGSFSIYLKP
jgi:hypothetical protein